MGGGERCISMIAGPRELETLRSFLHAVALELGVAEAQALDLVVAANELATNIVAHGYQGRPGPIELCVRTVGGAVEVRLRDEAPPFDPTALPPPRADLPPHLRPPGGMGLQLARHFSDELRYRAGPRGQNELTLVKRGLCGLGPSDEGV
jgi:serine/threonine-protein kinase RsbW